jgi:hypothetical protein
MNWKTTMTDDRSYRTGSSSPTAYRLVRRGGELLLQGRFDWTDGKQAGFDWRDIPTVEEEPPAMDPAPNRPLWHVMRDANHRAPLTRGADGSLESVGYAAELRAIADWLVPLEQPPHRGMRPGGSTLTYQETLSVERQRLRAALLAEADRAEAAFERQRITARLLSEEGE